MGEKEESEGRKGREGKEMVRGKERGRGDISQESGRKIKGMHETQKGIEEEKVMGSARRRRAGMTRVKEKRRAQRLATSDSTWRHAPTRPSS